MNTKRLYHPDLTITELNQTLPIDDKQLHYLTKVLRFKHQDSVQVFDGRGYHCQSELILEKKKGHLLVNSIPELSPPTRLNIQLAVAVIKNQPMDWFLITATASCCYQEPTHGLVNSKVNRTRRQSDYAHHY